MTLRRQIVNLCRSNGRNDLDQTTAVRHVAVVQSHATATVRMRISVQMFDARCIEGARTSNDTVHIVAFAEQQFGQIGAILTGDAGD